MKKTIIRSLGVLFSTILIIGSCTTKRTFTYLQDVEIAKQYTVAHDRETRLQVGDRIQIKVQSAFPELTTPFNGGGYIMPGQGKAQGATNTNNTIGYTVRRDGTIDYPVLGSLKVEDLTITEVSEMIRERIVESKYITDPNVTVVFDNFTIYLLGAFNNGGGNNTYQQTQGGDFSFTAYNSVGGGVLRIRERDKVNILEAIAMTGDLPEQAQVNKVNVIREENGKYTTYRLDLKSAKIFNSPAFYLKQHDIVYVEHLYKGQRVIDRAIQLGSYAFSTLSSIVAIAALLRSK